MKPSKKMQAILKLVLLGMHTSFTNWLELLENEFSKEERKKFQWVSKVDFSYSFLTRLFTTSEFYINEEDWAKIFSHRRYKSLKTREQQEDFMAGVYDRGASALTWCFLKDNKKYLFKFSKVHNLPTLPLSYDFIHDLKMYTMQELENLKR